MILLWHEGALGDLLLARVAPAVFEGEVVLAARHEARELFKQAGLVREAYPTWLGGLETWSPERVFLFSSSPWLIEDFRKRFGPRLFLLPTRPRLGKHLSLEILEALRVPSFPERGVLLASCSERQDDLVLLHPGSGGRFKCAPPAFWYRLYLDLEENGYHPEIILGPAETHLEKAFPGARVYRTLELREAIGKILRAQAFLGHDSGLTHLAAALGCRTLAFFGPTDWRSWAPFGSSVLVMVTECRCLHRKDPRLCEDPCLSRIDLKKACALVLSWLRLAFLGERASLPGLRVLRL